MTVKITDKIKKYSWLIWFLTPLSFIDLYFWIFRGEPFMYFGFAGFIADYTFLIWCIGFACGCLFTIIFAFITIRRVTTKNCEDFGKDIENIRAKVEKTNKFTSEEINAIMRYDEQGSEKRGK